MSALADLQRRLQRSVLARDPAPVRDQVSETGLAVYCHAYRARLQEVLERDFPALQTAMGPAAFDALAEHYIEAHPSRGPSLRHFGRHLPAFLEMHSDTRATPAWAELARFEWTLGEAFDAADQALLSEADLAELAPDAWPELRLDFHAAVHRLDLEWNAVAVWHTHESDAPLPTLTKSPQSVPWLIWRRDLVTRFRSLDEDEQILLDAMREGEPFAEACERLTTAVVPDEVPLRAASLLKAWIQEGLVHALA